MIIYFILILLILLIFWYNKNSAPTKKYARILYFYRPGCPWCELFNPEWKIVEDRLGNRVDKKNISEASSAAIVQQFKITGVPTIIMIDDAGSTDVYNGERTANAILACMKL